MRMFGLYFSQQWSHDLRGLEHCASSSNIPSNLPTTAGVFGAGLAIRPDIPLRRAGSQWFSLKLLPMDVVDAEGLDLEQVGGDKTCGKEQ